MKSQMGLLMNIVLGIIRAAVASAILSYFGVQLGGWIGFIWFAGFIGAVLLIWIARVVRGHGSLGSTNRRDCVIRTPPDFYLCPLKQAAGIGYIALAKIRERHRCK